MEQITIPSLSSIRNLIEPINWRLQQIEEKLQKLPKLNNPSKYYRNNDLKQLLDYLTIRLLNIVKMELFLLQGWEMFICITLMILTIF